MDDYHEFRHAHEIQIEEWILYWSPNYVSITRGIVPPIGATTTLNINLASGSESSIDNGGTTRGGGVRAHKVHCLHLT
jgi:hypothetical protein